MGEITPSMATAIGQSPAYKILIPVNRCNHYIPGCGDHNLGEYIKWYAKKQKRRSKNVRTVEFKMERPGLVSPGDK